MAQHYELPKNIPAVKDGEGFSPKGRTIVLCLDGTGDKFDDDNSNIVNFVSALKKDDKGQTTYYQTGIGTYSAGGLSSGFDAAADMAVGSGLGLHVRDAYHFLMHTYKENDKICIFGFSRGAYTARCLAGMVHKVGLLPPRNIAQIPFAYDIYKKDTPEGWKQSAEFKATFCIDARVYFVGVFDSVSSVGVIPRQLPLSSTPWSKSGYFRHAMALDERRSKFKVCRFQKKDWKEIDKLGVTNGDAATNSLTNDIVETGGSSYGTMSGSTSNGMSKKKQDANEAAEALRTKYEREMGHIQPYDTDVAEVWFSGCHADVGGGAVRNDERHKLSHIPLRWMIRQTFECNTGIIFHAKVLAEIGLDVHMLWPKYQALTVPEEAPPTSIRDRYKDGLPPRSQRSAKLEPHDKHDKKDKGFYKLKLTEAEQHGLTSTPTTASGSTVHVNGSNGEGPDTSLATTGKHSSEHHHDWLPEQIEDYFDSQTRSNDQLEVAWGWWILEVWPVQYKVQHKESDEWITKTGMNLGRYRAVEDLEPHIHWTVGQRMKDLGYEVKARFGRNATWKWVA